MNAISTASNYFQQTRKQLVKKSFIQSLDSKSSYFYSIPYIRKSSQNIKQNKKGHGQYK